MSEIQNDKLTYIFLSGYLGFYLFTELRILFSYYEPNCFTSEGWFFGRILLFHLAMALILSVLIETRYIQKNKSEDVKNIRLWNWLSLSMSILSGLFMVMYYLLYKDGFHCSRNYSADGQSNIPMFFWKNKKLYLITIIFLMVSSSFYFVLMSELLK